MANKGNGSATCIGRTRKSTNPTHERFQVAYEGKPPWDLGRPQPALVEIADQITGLFHVLSDVDRRAYVAALLSVTKPGGRLFLMCFSDEEPHDRGPRRIRQDEIRAAFADGWTVESIRPSQFEPNPQSKETFAEGGPRAWLAVIRRGS